LLWLVLMGCADAAKMRPVVHLDAGCENPSQFVAWTCGAEDCHEPSNPAGVADFVSPGVAERLIDQPPMDCAGHLLIDSAHPAASLLLNKITGNPVCGMQMPFMRPALTAAEAACVTAFVDELLSARPHDVDAGAITDAGRP
jgi:hypothetical protein